ncbi:putative exonuclease GOR isoform X3 [Archocentrus centrarchus]|uniref:putative exonuclease GOR isoform X3 n=1 Tax=Archocentrus centrarchus TaxID=63155 RepID=UPI0011EA32A4|nr:putative exonuclease GOR isoform X3 [Archocentrus centrarchus]
MFPSSSVFADINCPFSQHGRCERPHCLYKHAAKQARHWFGVSYESTKMDLTEGQSPYKACGDDCLHELERINKEIETVRHEVEQEQRRLSRYQTVQADSRNSTPASKCESVGKDVARGSYGPPPHTDLQHQRRRKYVVDNSKPRTDLEYDPLSNFSADLLSFSSSGKEQRLKSRKGLKSAGNTVPCGDRDPDAYQAPLSRSPSPELLDDSSEGEDLIIDVPPSPDKTGGQKTAESVAGKSSRVITEEVKEDKTEPVLPDSPSLHYTNTLSAGDSNKVHYSVENSQDLKTLSADKLNIIDLTGSLEDLAAECQKITAAIVEKIPEQQEHSWNNPQCKLASIAERMNPLKTPKNSLVCESPAADSSHRQTAQDRVQSQRLSEESAPSLVTGRQKNSSEMLGQTRGKAAVSHNSTLEPASGSSQFEGRRVLPTSVSSQPRADPSLEQNLVRADNEEVILINSSSEEEEEDKLNYSEMELSDSDPMEECYRIFMEANDEEKGNEECPGAPTGAADVEKMEVNGTSKGLPGRKRVAHEAKHTEPVAKSRPQPQVLVPLREPITSGFGSRRSVNSKTQQVQQRASMLTASVKGGQAFVSATSQKKPETQLTPSALTQTPETLQPAPVHNAFVNYIPLGPAVIEVGNNLHLILPDGAFPVPISSSSSPVTPILTPISQVHTSALTVRQTHHPPAVTPVQRCRPAAPVLIPAVARKPLLNSSFTSASLRSSSAVSAVSQSAVQASAKLVPAKRKLKQQCEAAKDKVPHDVRQRYVNMFTEEFLKTTPNVNDAFEKALAEEKTVYNRSANKLKYMSVAVNALKRLKNQSAVAAKDENKVCGQRLKGNIPLNPKKLKGDADDTALYESLKDYILTDEKLTENNYPIQHPEKHGSAVLFADHKKVNADPLKRICCRCGATYSVSQSGKHIRKEECNYHYGKGVENRVPGGVETRYSCCQGVMGAPGCQVFKLHVHDSLSLDGFVSTVPRCPSDTSCPSVYSLDCEMCYTVHGLELSRVTVVNSSVQVVYDSFVKPDNEVIDYNNRFSGIGEEDVKGHHTSLREVQETLLSFINADTILIGHSLETDLCLLKLLHGMVVDTSVVFPHRLGPPHKLTLNKLTAEYLRRIIQESVCGHDTAEDAAACMELMLWKVKEDGKSKKMMEIK